ncbi:MAG: helix-turn-helix domain-containing protein [Prevotella sp.]|nr:helix-turn-helix domain-containing protein [Prevotella sp.]
MKHTTIKRLCLTALFLAIYTSTQAQQLQAKLSHYSTEDGLASNAISKMKQDDWGYIWIATWNGLTRFDGYDFTNYRTGTMSRVPNLHNRIEDLAIDNQQNVWMRMYDNRIFVMKRSVDKIINPFEGIKGSDEFRNNQVIFVTSSGDVYVPIIDKGIYKMRVEQDRVNCQLVTTGGLTITSMAEGYHDDIWLGTNEGIHRLDASNMTVERKGLFLDEYVTCLFSNGYNIFAGTKSGKILSFAYGQEPTVIRQQAGNDLHGLFVDSHDLIWFADDKAGVLMYDPETGVERRFVQTVMTHGYESGGVEFNDVNGTVWIRMNFGGYGYYDREAQEVRYFHNDPSNPWNLSNSCNATLETLDGVVFESTIRRGLDKLEIMKNTIERKLMVENPTSLPDNDVRAFYYDTRNRSLLMGNKSGMLSITDNDGNRTFYTHSDNGQAFGRIYGISKDSKENYWVSSKDNGLFKMTPRAGGGYSIVNYCHDDNDVHSLNDNHAYQTLEDGQGNIWVATYGGGVNVLPNGSSQFLHCNSGMEAYPHNFYRKARTLAIDKDGKIWAGTTDGILLFSMKDGKVQVEKLEYSEEEPDNILYSNDIVCLGRDQRGMMWVGTNGGGLGHTIGKDNQGRWLFENFGARDGLPSEEILSLAFDSRGSVWFATEHILCSFDQDKRIFTTFSTLEGVDETMCSESAALVLPSGNILFGTTTSGYYVVDRNKLMSNNAAVFKLRLTGFWVDNELQSPRLTNLYDYYVPESKAVTLPSHSSSFAFRFASLNFQLQHRVHYQYMLEGYDSDWRNAGPDRMASYENVPAGEYRFQVRAFMLESPDKYDMKEIMITIPPMFLFSSGATWLYMLIVAVAGLLLLFLSQQRIRQQVKNKRNQDAKNSEDAKPSSFIVKLEEWLEAHYAEQNLSFETFMEDQGINRADFEDSLRAFSKKSPREFLIDYRIEKARQLLEQTSDSVADISFNTGFADPMQFNRLFTERNGMTPSQYRDHSHQSSEHTDEYEVIE